MKAHHHDDRTYSTVILVGTLLGALAGAVAYLPIWLYLNPASSGSESVTHLRSADLANDPFLLFLAVGAAVGFLLAGRVVHNPFAVATLRVAHRLTIHVAWGLLGALFGLIAYIAFWTATHAEEPFLSAVGHLPEAFQEKADPLLAFLLAGGLTGFTVGVYVRGDGALRRAGQAGTAAIAGALSGLVIYSFGYVITNYPTLPDSGAYVLHFAEAIYSFHPIEFFFVGLGAVVGLMMARYSWRLYGVFTLISLVCVVVGYLFYSLAVTLPSIPPERRAFSGLLFIAEASSLVMVVLYSFYTIDVATRKHWRRTPADAPFSKYYMPKVAFQVPTFNEPPELVLETLKHLVAMDYPEDRYLVMVLDDSTRPECSEPLRAFCEANRLIYVHRTQRGGYKAGALNHSLQFVPGDVELLAIVDADYHIEPEFLRETVGFFIDPKLGWLQTPQDYRNRHQSFLTEQYYLADAYFYRTILPSRNEENSIIFCGTMGILRKNALLEVGGWGEQYITEDAELSVRLSIAGWRSLYINKTYGRGLIPPTFEGYKKQHYRWAFGGGKIMRGHFRDIVFGKFTARQRFDYFVGSVHWFEGVFVLLIAFTVLAMALGEIFGVPLITHHRNEILFIGLVPWFLLVDGISRIHMVLRRSLSLSFGGTVRVLGMWFSVKFSNTIAAVKAFVGFDIPFVRTPKSPATRLSRRQALRHAIRITRFESTIAGLMAGAALLLAFRAWLTAEQAGGVVLTRLFLVLWLVYYALVFAAAPIYAYKSYATFVPEAEAQKVAAPAAGAVAP